VTHHFDDDMIVLEKWEPQKPITAIYWDGAKERYYGKRFLIEVPDKDEVFISDNDGSQLELVSTDWRPVAEMVFYKERGKDQRANEEVSMEDFIAVKGISALGNQFYTEKLKGLNWLEPLAYEMPESTKEEVSETSNEETIVEENRKSAEGDTYVSKEAKLENPQKEDDDESQTTLF